MVRDRGHVAALDLAAIAATTSAPPHRRKRRIPPGVAALAAAAAITGTTTHKDCADGTVVDLNAYAKAARERTHSHDHDTHHRGLYSRVSCVLRGVCLRLLTEVLMEVVGGSVPT